MDIKSTDNITTTHVNMLIYGRAGIGKTTSLATAPSPLILSAEAGLLSLIKHPIPYITIDSIDTLRTVYTWLTDSKEAEQYETVCIDSISEVCDLVFVDCKRRVGTNPAELYPELRSIMLPALTMFRSLPKHVVVTAREQTKSIKRETIVTPAMVGNKLVDDLPYVFDMVLHYTLDDSGKRVIHTNSDTGSLAKDRTGLLADQITDTTKLIADIINLVLSRNGQQTETEAS